MSVPSSVRARTDGTIWNGQKGYTTIHAGSARQALSRLRFVCQLADTSSEIPMTALNSLVSESVDIVVHCAREGGRPQVTEIIAVEEPAAGFEATQFTVTELFRRPRRDAPLEWTGLLPIRAARFLEESGHDPRRLLGVPDQVVEGDGRAWGAHERRPDGIGVAG